MFRFSSSPFHSGYILPSRKASAIVRFSSTSRYKNITECRVPMVGGGVSLTPQSLQISYLIDRVESLGDNSVDLRMRIASNLEVRHHYFPFPCSLFPCFDSRVYPSVSVVFDPPLIGVDHQEKRDTCDSSGEVQ